MLKCSFCEQPLLCKACSKPFLPTRPEAHAALYQPDMMVFCPECKALLVCKCCDYAYGEEEEEDEGGPDG